MTKHKHFIAVCGALIIVGLIVASFMRSPRQEGESQGAAVAGRTQSGGVTEEVESFVPDTRFNAEGWQEYENIAFKFALSVPPELRAREYKEAGGAMSVIFENSQTGKGFQVYVTSYEGMQITRERFQLDVSSGIMSEPVDVVISGVRGTMFFSKNSIMGDTREVWFINNGLLYEVVTYKQLDEWLAEIMRTWRFL